MPGAARRGRSFEIEAIGDQGGETEAALLGEDRRELLLGEIGRALRGGIFAAAEPSGVALPGSRRGSGGGQIALRAPRPYL